MYKNACEKDTLAYKRVTERGVPTVCARPGVRQHLHHQVRGNVKIQVLATARFCKFLQTLATTSLPTLSQVCQHLASSGRGAIFPDAPLMTY